MIRRVALCVAAAVCMAVLVGSGARAARIARLSDNVAPVSYNLFVTPYAERHVVQTTESVAVRAYRTVPFISMNAANLTYEAASIDGKPARVVEQTSIEQVDLLPATGKPVGKGMHVIGLRVSARIAGFAADSGYLGFANTGTDAEPFLVTMFEPSAARRMFACFDEPAFRARFHLTVTAPRDQTVVSNMPQTRRTVSGDRAVSTFAPTPPMPVYLLTVDVARMRSLQANAGAIPVRVLTTPALLSGARTALRDAVDSLVFYQRFFGVKYPLPKLDLVVTPGKDEEALEQWGAITYYSPFIVDAAAHGPNVPVPWDDVRARYTAFDLVAHEIAHQWVGDLVTMHWWRDTVVAEGLAQYSAARAALALHPEWQSWQFNDEEVRSILDRGVRAGTGPVVHPVATDLDKDDEIEFDQSTYDKPMALLEQYARVEGASAVQGMLRRYLQRYAYGSATMEQLFSLLPAGGTHYADAWLKQPGFPDVTVSKVCAAGRYTITLRQDAFAFDAATRRRFASRLWPVPVVITAGGHNDTFFMNGRTAVRHDGRCGSPVVIDGNFQPYYRVELPNLASWQIDAWPQRAQQWIAEGALRSYARGAGSTAEFLTAATATAPRLTARGLSDEGVRLLSIDGSLADTPLREPFERIVARSVRPALLRFAQNPKVYSNGLIWVATSGADPQTAEPGAFEQLLSNLAHTPANPDFGFALPAILAGQSATFEQATKVLDRPAVRFDQRAALPNLFVRNIRSEAVIKQIGEWLVSHPSAALTTDDFIGDVATLHPRYADAYLRAHTHGRAQKDAFLEFALVYAEDFWSVETPQAYGDWLRSIEPQDNAQYAEMIKSAVDDLTSRRTSALQTQREVADWLAARREARSSVTMRLRSEGCVAKSHSYHQGCSSSARF